jgi:hypothetical protein
VLRRPIESTALIRHVAGTVSFLFKPLRVIVGGPREVIMRTLASLLTLVALFTCQRTNAQSEPAIVPDAQAVGPQKPVQQYYVEDGGAHGGVLESIVVPPKLNAPFTLLLETEWVRGLPDGSSITTVNRHGRAHLHGALVPGAEEWERQIADDHDSNF